MGMVMGGFFAIWASTTDEVKTTINYVITKTSVIYDLRTFNTKIKLCYHCYISNTSKYHLEQNQW